MAALTPATPATPATPLQFSGLDAEDITTLDDSTAPTTPDGSSSFSPNLRPQDDDAGYLNVSSLSAALAAAAPAVRNVCFIGAGFVGGPTAAVIALHNPHIRVTVVDKDHTRIRRWNSKHPPIYEPGLNDILRVVRDGSTATKGDAAARQPNLIFTTDVATCVREADVVLIAVNTPTKERGNGAGSATDMAAFEAVTAMVARHASPGAIIVEKSTVPCRTAQLVQDTLALHRPGVEFQVLSNPEFLAAGTAIKDLQHADRILIGSSNTAAGHKAATALASVYASWIPTERIITTNVFSSELAKLVANSMLAQRISSINSIAAVCDATGADIDEVARAVGADPRIGSKFLKAGIGFGGSCFKKDILSLVYLAETLVLPEVAQYWRAVVEMNEFARNRLVTRVLRCLNNTLTGKKVTVLGFAFKKDTNDTRESPALDIIHALAKENPREIAVYDPLCTAPQMAEQIGRYAGTDVLKSNGGPVVVYTDVYGACHGSDAVLITTEFDEFKNGPAEVEAQLEVSSGAAGKLEGTPDNQVVSADDSAAAVDGQLAASLNPVPPCEEDCPECQAEEDSAADKKNDEPQSHRKARLDWTKVYYDMNSPHWVLDGRGVLDISVMEKLGFRVESIGRQSGLARKSFPPKNYR
ncbi:UDP-glucose/GDP-mannose dehydrogenase family, NAD binding domain-containing protein [Dichotomopilus funicola]|uniref:UDP-glucose 6-dehydrogenase n=1 Tax=Dichotomopilus funicola TaxID=1934379 RepID=A0AAN6ZR60_9PEZI|nr:UDP-glucose/GDP-mannose dehydrogenase family, NAD binding domain-containing protein [Dichotomopilus funicola]